MPHMTGRNSSAISNGPSQNLPAIVFPWNREELRPRNHADAFIPKGVSVEDSAGAAFAMMSKQTRGPKETCRRSVLRIYVDSGEQVPGVKPYYEHADEAKNKNKQKKKPKKKQKNNTQDKNEYER